MAHLWCGHTRWWFTHTEDLISMQEMPAESAHGVCHTHSRDIPGTVVCSQRSTEDGPAPALAPTTSCRLPWLTQLQESGNFRGSRPPTTALVSHRPRDSDGQCAQGHRGSSRASNPKGRSLMQSRVGVLSESTGEGAERPTDWWCPDAMPIRQKPSHREPSRAKATSLTPLQHSLFC